MKFALPLLVLLAVASPLYAYQLPTTGDGALAKELQDILDLFPLKTMQIITKAYWVQDKDFQAAVQLMKGEHIKQFVLEIEAKEAYKNLINWIQANGLDIYELINRYHKDLGLPPLVSSFDSTYVNITGGLNGYISDIKRVTPENDILLAIYEKFIHSDVFRNLILHLISPEALELFESALNNPHYLAVEREMQEAGVNKTTWESNFSLFMIASVMV